MIGLWSFLHNLLLETGSFSNQMKMGKVISLYKSGSKHSFSNYKPISILPEFSKCLANIGSEQFRSILHSIIDSVEGNSNAIDNKQFVTGVFIDPQKSFDSNHVVVKTYLGGGGEMASEAFYFEWICSIKNN